MDERREEGVERSEDRVTADRLAKLERLRQQGVEPYAYAFHASHTAAGALALFAGWEAIPGESETEGPPDQVTLAGRIVARRVMGKSTFMHLADRTGRVQLYCRVNELGDAY